ncbi:MAG: hypothetical protein ACREID_01760, partial [Planctomycetota bacterium]
MTLALRAVATRGDRRAFLDLPARLHGAHPPFVPPLRAALARLLDRRRNPFWRHAEAKEWLALRDGRPVGRIGACHDRDLEARAPGRGVFGLFECGEDAGAARALFAAAGGWLKARGLRRARGPLNYSIHDTAGLLVEGFDTPPTFDTTWNPPHYEKLWTDAGFVAAQDLL